MSKKVNFGTINAQSLEMFSTFHVATLELKSLKETFKSDSTKINAEIEKLISDRETAISTNTMTRDEAIAKYDIVPQTQALNVLKNKYLEDCKPIKESIKSTLELIDDSIYEAYKLEMEKGELAPLSKSVHKFLVEIGCMTEESTSSKFAQIMAIRCSGNKKASGKNSNEHYVVSKNASQFKELFMLNFLEYVIIEKKVVVVNDDATLSMRVYEEEA